MTTARAQPESFRGRSLQASLTVDDLQHSLSWYREVVGFVVDREYTRDGAVRAVALKAGAVRILISQDDGAKGAGRTKGAGFSLFIATAQNVDAIARRIRESGGVLESAPADTPWGTRAFRVRDPDGFRWTISTEEAGR
jgi:uncharacterized glyoxalase superfamily protein PhnB